MKPFRRFPRPPQRTADQPDARGEYGHYIPSEVVARAVNTALAVGQPLLVTGEPGVGKSTLAFAVAEHLGLGDVQVFVTRSDSTARDALYSFDHMQRLCDAQSGDRTAVAEPRRYLRRQGLGRLLRYRERAGTAADPDPPQGLQGCLLVDEIDKAPRDFPNDLLHEFDRMEHYVVETGDWLAHPRATDPTERPFVLVTSNAERDLPDAFLRRCVYCHIEFPDAATLLEIVRQRLRIDGPGSATAEAAVERIGAVRAQGQVEKRPATGELLAWTRVLLATETPADRIHRAPLAELFPEALFKTLADRRLVYSGAIG